MKLAMRMFAGLVLVTMCGLLAACETTEQDRDSSMPWNQPQPWEGAPGIPGMGQ